MSDRATPGSDFSRARRTRAPRSRDPLGKAALFSVEDDTTTVATVTPITAPEGRGASHLFSRPETRPGTLVLDCSHCAQQTRVSYVEFAALHFPVWAWLPAPDRTHRHFLRCPACHRFTWLRVGWLE
jgi:hypothetical protein